MPVRLFEELYYLAHGSNLDSILDQGILSHNEVIRRGLRPVDVSNPGVQLRRARIEPVFGRPVHDYAPLYFNPRNPMLYALQALQNELVILVVRLEVLTEHDHIYTDGNAASSVTIFAKHHFYSLAASEVLGAHAWTNLPDGRRRRCAEVLVYPEVAPKYIARGVCRNPSLVSQIRGRCGLPVSLDSSMFF